MNKKIYLLLLFAAVIAYVWICSENGLKPIGNTTIHFKPRLSAYGLFSGDQSDLVPAHGVEILNLSSTLFTDYAEKQRLIRLPPGKQMRAFGNGLPEFPEGTVIAKTFYYSQPSEKRRKLMETRLLILKDGQWNAGTYRWSEDQKDAVFLAEGADVPVSFTGPDGKFRNISYHIPAQSDCGNCHRNVNQLVPIGPKLRNLNTDVLREGRKINQLLYLHQSGLLSDIKPDTIGTIPDYHDTKVPVDQRARAYFTMNCSHCHQPSGLAGNLSLNLNYATDFDHTGIAIHKQNIIERISAMGPFHMPKTGTTIIDEQGVELLRQYIKSLPQN
jgi:uncharacterized repeat protein (TIGR03806 family)